MSIRPFYYCESCQTDHPTPPEQYHANSITGTYCEECETKHPDATPTGIPYILCHWCTTTHPQGRSHCIVCRSPSLFVNPDTLLCRKCDKEIQDATR